MDEVKLFPRIYSFRDLVSVSQEFIHDFDKLFEYHDEFYIDFNSEGVWDWYHGIHDMYQNVYIGALSTLDEVPGIKAM